MTNTDTIHNLLDNMVEKRYQLRLEHNHGDMKWYAYYAGKEQRQLFDKEIDWKTGSDTPLEALEKLRLLVQKDRWSV
jgi:isocitrate dehydrogenase